MNWTSETPTKAGDYAWKRDENTAHELAKVENYEGTLMVFVTGNGRWFPANLGGLWCRLVPADETVPKEEVEKAWREGRDNGMHRSWANPDVEFLDSRARRVIEGTEP